MVSRRDQLQSHQLMRQRMVSAFMEGDPDRVHTTFRNSIGLFVVSLALGALALAVVGLHGVVVHDSGGNWRTDKAVIVERETGARYVYRAGVLHPVLNYASARLVLGQPDPPTVLVSAVSLRQARHGAPWGIVGAPDSLPAPGSLLRGAWTLCTRTRTDDNARRTVDSVLSVGDDAPREPVPADRVLVVRAPTDDVYLVWGGHRFLVPEPDIVLTALGLGQAPVVPVAPAWVNGLVVGPDIARIPIAGRGGSTTLQDAFVGQVVVSQPEGGGAEYYVVLSDGIADITQVQADILLDDPDTAAAYPHAAPTPIRRTDLGTARRSATVLSPPAGAVAPPARTPGLAEVDGDAVLCATFGNATDAPRISTDSRELNPGVPEDEESTSISVPPGRGVLVESVMAVGVAGPLALITDTGRRYPLSSNEVAGYLGYGGVAPVPMPAGLVALVPPGPSLDPAAAAGPADDA